MSLDSWEDFISECCLLVKLRRDTKLIWRQVEIRVRRSRIEELPWVFSCLCFCGSRICNLVTMPSKLLYGSDFVTHTWVYFMRYWKFHPDFRRWLIWVIHSFACIWYWKRKKSVGENGYEKYLRPKLCVWPAKKNKEKVDKDMPTTYIDIFLPKNDYINIHS